MSHSPPPPYGAGELSQVADRSSNETRGNHQSTTNETIPKWSHHQAHQDRTRSSRDSTSSSPHNGLQQSNLQPSDSRRRSSIHADLAARKGFFSLITVEPLAFLAILAVFIEFPSTQDLIYTKICIQTISSNPADLTPTSLPSIISDESTTNAPKSPTHINSSIAPPQVNSFSLQGGVVNGQIIDFSINRVPEMSMNDIRALGVKNYTRTTRKILTTEIDQSLPTNKLPINKEQPRSAEFYRLCDKLNQSTIPEDIKQVISEKNSFFWLIYQLIYSVLCLISIPYWGGMSDKIGRLIPLNVSIMVAAAINLMSVLFSFLIINSKTFHINWLLTGAVLAGLSGGQAVVLVNSFSLIRDDSSTSSRSKRITLLEAVVFASHSAGFYINKHIMSLGLESKERFWLNRHFIAFTSCFALNLLCILYAACKLRHKGFHRFLNNFEREQQVIFVTNSSSSAGTSTLNKSGNQSGRTDTMNSNDVFSSADRLRELTSSTPDDLDGPIAQSDKKWTSWGAIITLKYYKDTFLTATKSRDSRTIILLLLVCGFISALSLAILMSLFYIYLRSPPFNWTTSQYSAWNSLSSLTRGGALVTLTLTMRLIKGWNVPDQLIAAIGFISKGTGLMLIATAKTSSILDWAILAFMLSEFVMPPIRSLLSKLVIGEEVAKIYSCLAAVQSICFISGNVIFYLAYTSLDIQVFYRLSFMVISGFQFAAAIIMLIIYTSMRRRVMVI